MKKITRAELQAYKEYLEFEQELLDRIVSSNEDIYKVYYNDKMMIIQFKNGKSVNSSYLQNLKNLIDYQEYSLEVATITEEFFKIKYTEQVLQLNIIL